MNLLERFHLQHVQVMRLNAELIHPRERGVEQQAKVELHLAPRPLKADSGDELPGYRVSARLRCSGGRDPDTGPQFTSEVAVEAVYRQIDGEPVDVAAFAANHASLARQLYPLMQAELRTLLLRLGLERLHMPFDLPARVEEAGQPAVEISHSVH